MRFLLLIAAAGAGLLWPTLAAAKPPALSGEAAITADVKCLIMGFALSQSADAKTKGVGQMASMFYWGRLQGRGALDGIQSRIVQHADWFQPDQVMDATQSCGAEMKAAGDDMKSLGEALAALKQR